ncbi:MAG: hypothetical protein NT171_14990 [Planctomycetota bacterium]|nr:hypothetical protein [Planctomycetota bacterium]
MAASRPDPRPQARAPSAAPLVPASLAVAALVVAAIVESIWLLFLGWMAVGGG